MHKILNKNVFWECFRCLAGLKETLVWGLSGSEVYLLCFKMCCCFFPGHVGQEFISPACLRVSQRKEKKKRWLLKQPILLLTCLLPTEHVISHHNSGLLLQIQRSAWPVLPEHSDGYQTRDGWHTTTTLTAFPLGFFFFFWAGMDTTQKCKVSDACYRWQKL